MSKICLGGFARKVYHISCVSTILLSLLGCFSGLMIEWGQAPLQYTILTRQIIERIPTFFLCGMLAMFLCDIIDKHQKA